jgi:hypothetical protein
MNEKDIKEHLLTRIKCIQKLALQIDELADPKALSQLPVLVRHCS